MLGLHVGVGLVGFQQRKQKILEQSDEKEKHGFNERREELPTYGTPPVL